MEKETVNELHEKALRLAALKKSQDVIEFLTILRELGIISGNSGESSNYIS